MAAWLLAIGGLQLFGLGYLAMNTFAEKSGAWSSLEGMMPVLEGCFIAAAGALAISLAAIMFQEERHVR